MGKGGDNLADGRASGKLTETRVPRVQEVKMRKNLLVSGLMVFLGTLFLSLVPFEGANSEVEHPRMGLRFTVQGLDDVGVGKVKGGVGLKAWLSDKAAVRASFGLGVNSLTTKSTDEDYTDYKEQGNELSFGGGLEFHPMAGKRVSPYLGVGVTFSTSVSDEEPSIHKEYYPGTTKLRKRSSSGFGIGGLVGVEFFMGDRLSLSGEYEIGLSLSTTKYKREVVPGQGVVQPKEQKTTASDIGVSTSSLILTFYF